ncbi:DUF5722 domain-containing protein, partial [Coraliomargarita sp. SDUM461004]
MQSHLYYLVFFFLTLSALGQSLELIPNRSNHLEIIAKNSDELTLTTTGVDPNATFGIVDTSSANKESYVLSFEYFCPEGIPFTEVFYGQGNSFSWSEDRKIIGSKLPVAQAWQPYAVDLKNGSKNAWNGDNRYFRIDFGRRAGVTLQIRNLQLRTPTQEELASSEEAAAKLAAKLNRAKKLDTYLMTTSTHAVVDKVVIDANSVHVIGKKDPSMKLPVYLVEFEPHEDPWLFEGGTVLEKIGPLANEFSVSIPRFNNDRDRLANRYAVAKIVDGKPHIICHAVWASDVSGVAERSMPRLYPKNKKGLGGISFKDGIFEEDLSELGITSSTINISLGPIMNAGRNPIEFIHQGKTHFFNPNALDKLDKKIRWMTDQNIVVSAILLVAPNADQLIHPEYNSAGIYSMANMSEQDASDAFRAVVAFLAERYSRPDRKYGWISHWIVFNEVDYGWIWTNMGEQPMPLYMNAYEKAMRLVWLETRRYNPTAEVFISLTNHWTFSPADELRAYPARDLLDRLALYSQRTGDYFWSVAYHPYPQSLRQPRTWEDNDATASFDTLYVTPKNIEVLDAYLRQPQFLYEDKTRTVLLSEQGYHTPDYSQKSMKDKAAAIAYTWAKIMPLDSIESFHYHRWVDHPMEGGLKVGLRTLPSKEHPFGIRKEPAFSVYSALETPAEASTTAPFKSVIGIDDWT